MQAGRLWPSGPSLELELIQTQMTQKPVLRAEVYARALRDSQINSENSECITQEVITFWDKKDKITYCRMWQQSLTLTRHLQEFTNAQHVHTWHRCDSNSE